MQPVVLTGNQVEVVFRVTYQATNFPAYRLLELGLVPENLDNLIATLGVFRDAAARAERVRILFDGLAGETDRYLPGETAPTDAGQPEDELHVDLSGFWASRWCPLIGLVLSGLGRRELFLRTGYEWNEIGAAVANFEDVN
jgi:hypothetical protein